MAEEIVDVTPVITPSIEVVEGATPNPHPYGESGPIKYPKDLDGNTDYRLRMMLKLQNNPRMKAIVNSLCKDDILFWINSFCLAEGTLVVTDRGLVAIENVKSYDLVWDGDRWISQDGPVHQGSKLVHSAYGIKLTPDHKVWTQQGWQQSVLGFDRAEIQLPYGYSERWILPEHNTSRVALPMRLRKHNHGGWWKPSSWKKWALWKMPSRNPDSRNEQNSSLCRLVLNEGEVFQSKNIIVPSLWWAWNRCLRTLAKVRELFFGHGLSSEITHDRTYEQRRELRSVKLSVGESQRTGSKHTEGRAREAHTNFTRAVEAARNSYYRGSELQRHTGENQKWRDGGRPLNAEPQKAEVYDLLNCGTKKAFTVIDENGRPLLVHNCATYNPRKNPSTIPFITYDYEDKLILDLVEAIRDQKDILIDKSRDMGVTWCVLLVFTWFWQFHGEGYDFLCGSRKEQYIDGIGNMDTLMEKIRFLIRNQPKWMRPKDFDWKRDSNYMKIVNPESKATITGEATNANFSRSGRRRAIFFDEFAFWETDSEAWRASADSTNCRIVVSTPCGFNNQFAKLRHSGSIPVRSLHWTLHPEKDRAWYENECKRRNNDAVEIAQELDINYEGSEEGVLFEFASLKAAVHNQPLPSPDRIVVVCDPAGQGEDEAVFYVSNNGAIIERKIFNTSTDPQLAAEAVLLINKWRAQVFEADSIGNSVCDIVTQLLGKNEKGVKVIKFKSSEKSKDPTYFNRRDEVYHQASLAVKSGNVAMDDDYTLQRQLNATKYKKDNGRIYITSKEEVKDIVKSSPDRADAWVLIADALKYTHSLKEIRQHENFRQVVHHDEVRSGQEYGDWGDQI